MQLHVKAFSCPINTDDSTPLTIKHIASKVIVNNGYDSLTPSQKTHAWFTDGSAKYIGAKRYWKAIAYNPSTDIVLEHHGEGGSSQYAELYAVWLCLKKEQGQECHIFTDS